MTAARTSCLEHQRSQAKKLYGSNLKTPNMVKDLYAPLSNMSNEAVNVPIFVLFAKHLFAGMENCFPASFTARKYTQIMEDWQQRSLLHSILFGHTNTD